MTPSEQRTRTGLPVIFTFGNSHGTGGGKKFVASSYFLRKLNWVNCSRTERRRHGVQRVARHVPLSTQLSGNSGRTALSLQLSPTGSASDGITVFPRQPASFEMPLSRTQNYHRGVAGEWEYSALDFRQLYSKQHVSASTAARRSLAVPKFYMGQCRFIVRDGAFTPELESDAIPLRDTRYGGLILCYGSSGFAALWDPLSMEAKVRSEATREREEHFFI